MYKTLLLLDILKSRAALGQPLIPPLYMIGAPSRAAAGDIDRSRRKGLFSPPQASSSRRFLRDPVSRRRYWKLWRGPVMACPCLGMAPRELFARQPTMVDEQHNEGFKKGPAPMKHITCIEDSRQLAQAPRSQGLSTIRPRSYTRTRCAPIPRIFARSISASRILVDVSKRESLPPRSSASPPRCR